MSLWIHESRVLSLSFCFTCPSFTRSCLQTRGFHQCRHFPTSRPISADKEHLKRWICSSIRCGILRCQGERGIDVLLAIGLTSLTIKHLLVDAFDRDEDILSLTLDDLTTKSATLFDVWRISNCCGTVFRIFTDQKWLSNRLWGLRTWEAVALHRKVDSTLRW